MKVKFISYLEVFQIIKILCSGRIFDEIFYFNISKPARILLRFLKPKKDIKPFTFNLDEIRTESGENITVRIFGEDSNNVCRDLELNRIIKNPFVKKFGDKFNRKKVIYYFKRRHGREMRDVVVFVNVVDWYLNRNGEKLKPPIEFSIERAFSFEVLKDFASREYNISLTSYTSFRNVLRFAHSLFGNLYLSAVAIMIPIFHSIRSPHGSQGQRKGNDIPVLATQYQPGGLRFDLTRRCSFFWLLKSKIPHKQVLICFERTEIPVTDDMNSVLRKNGLKAIAMSKGATSTNKVPVYKPSMTLTQMLARLTGSIILQIFKDLLYFRLESLWYLAGAFYFAREYAKAYDFYKCMGIKANIEGADTNLQCIPRWLALEAVGGVSIVYQRNHIPIRMLFLGSTADVYFLFGPHYFPIFRGCENDNHTMLTCGYITDYSFVTVRERSKALRKKLMAKGVKFVLCYFDENSHDEHTHRKSAHVYETFLRWAISDKTNGLICSPKRPATLSARLSSIAQLMKEAGDTGRCIFMEGDYYASNYSVEAALASDMVISHLAGGTTALESVLAGCRVLILDLHNLYSFPEYRKGKNKIVFDNLQNMFNAIEKYRGDPKSFDELGNIDMMHMIKDKDPFQDGKAAERISQYLHWLLEKFDEGESREAVIKYANNNYSDIWGHRNLFCSQKNFTQ